MRKSNVVILAILPRNFYKGGYYWKSHTYLQCLRIYFLIITFIGNPVSLIHLLYRYPTLCHTIYLHWWSTKKCIYNFSHKHLFSKDFFHSAFLPLANNYSKPAEFFQPVIIMRELFTKSNDKLEPGPICRLCVLWALNPKAANMKASPISP